MLCVYSISHIIINSKNSFGLLSPTDLFLSAKIFVSRFMHHDTHWDECTKFIISKRTIICQLTNCFPRNLLFIYNSNYIQGRAVNVKSGAYFPEHKNVREKWEIFGLISTAGKHIFLPLISDLSSQWKRKSWFIMGFRLLT